MLIIFAGLPGGDQAAIARELGWAIAAVHISALIPWSCLFEQAFSQALQPLLRSLGF